MDRHVDGGWVTFEQARRTAVDKNVLRMTTIGYLVADEPEYLLVAGTISPGVRSDDDLVNGTTQIPRVAVQRVRRLSLSR